MFPSAPALSVVKHVVKEPFLIGRGIRCRRLSRRALFHVWGIVPLTKPESKSFLPPQAYQFLARLIKEIFLRQGVDRSELVSCQMNRI